MENKTLDIFPWSQHFVLGVAELDEQHKLLLKMLNKIASGIVFNIDTSELNGLYDHFILCVEQHFKAEELYWGRIDLDGHQLAEHQNERLQFLQHIIELKIQLSDRPDHEFVEKMLSFISHWLAIQILKNDKYMVVFVGAIESGKDEQTAQLLAEQQFVGINKMLIDVVLSNYQSLTDVTVHLAREVSVVRQTQLQLIESEKQLQELMDYAQIGYWNFPAQGEKVQWSEQMFDLFGLTQDLTPGPETLCSIMNKDYHGTFLSSMQLSFESGKEHHVEYPITRPSDGEVRWIACRGKVIYDNEGKPERMTGFVQDITAHKETEDKIERLAFYDPLTSLPNRRLLFDRLEQALLSGSRSQKYNALLFLDIDQFKILNDTHGHHVGDMLLVMLTDRLEKCLRKEDNLARIGGDEFVIILEGLDENAMTAALQTERVALFISNAVTPPFEFNHIQYNCSISIGIALFNGDQVSASELMKQADIAMYQAKMAGRNSLCFFDPKMQQEMTNQMELELDLRQAIKEEQFELFYQIQTNPEHCVLGVEALIRWHHPERGLIGPMDFISLAEETGLILPIGEWVIKTACLQLQKWHVNPSMKHLSLSINVSSKQFLQSDFASKILSIVSEFNIDPRKLKIELTESLLLHDVSKTIQLMTELGSTGIQFSLDDFGTGYSSLQYLKQLPLYQLKIDRSFVCDLISNSSDQSIVRTIISMAHSLGLDVIAEGVETDDQLQFLMAEGCLNYQGYLFSKPVPVSEILNLVDFNQSAHFNIT